MLVGVLVAVLDAGIGGADGDRATTGLETEAGVDDRAAKGGRSEARIGEARINEAQFSGILGDNLSAGGELAAVPKAGVSNGSRGEQGEGTGTKQKRADHRRNPPWQGSESSRDAARPHTNHGMRQPGVKKRVAVGS